MSARKVIATCLTEQFGFRNGLLGADVILEHITKAGYSIVNSATKEELVKLNQR